MAKTRHVSRANAAKGEKPRSWERPGRPSADRDGFPARGAGLLVLVGNELRAHAPFTMVGALTGAILMVAFGLLNVPRAVSAGLFWSLHPAHVLLSALVTTAMFTLHGRRTVAGTILVGYLGSVGIATLSDCVIPYLAEVLLDLPQRGIHLGFIEKWWIVNPLAATGIVVGWLWPHTQLPHAGHVLLSTWASLFHIKRVASGGSLHTPRDRDWPPCDRSCHNGS